MFAVNFRHVLYSAALGRRTGLLAGWQKLVAFFFLTDPQYAASEARADRNIPLTMSWYMGMALPIYVFWVAEAWVGVHLHLKQHHRELSGLPVSAQPVLSLGQRTPSRRWLSSLISSASKR